MAYSPQLASLLHFLRLKLRDTGESDAEMNPDEAVRFYRPVLVSGAEFDHWCEQIGVSSSKARESAKHFGWIVPVRPNADGRNAGDVWVDLDVITWTVPVGQHPEAVTPSVFELPSKRRVRRGGSSLFDSQHPGPGLRKIIQGIKRRFPDKHPPDDAQQAVYRHLRAVEYTPHEQPLWDLVRKLQSLNLHDQKTVAYRSFVERMSPEEWLATKVVLPEVERYVRQNRLDEPPHPNAPQSRPRLACSLARVRLCGPKEGATVDGVPKCLTETQYEIISALVESPRPLSMRQLDEVSGHTEARKRLSALCKDPDWARVIVLAKKKGNGYWIRR